MDSAKDEVTGLIPALDLLALHSALHCWRLMSIDELADGAQRSVETAHQVWECGARGPPVHVIKGGIQRASEGGRGHRRCPERATNAVVTP
ncbi:hypothetical protein AAFF_G00167640 [Aldrovandia affinis]|uniref:Uncharacterized protein n=1 Tax=Aldrovandia affinis TaxID=143900 RepID=A0AAD7RLT9_9TELE|nr:hypothetical protein AAFF_G00167640 [Aldrovandia affinis]